MHSQETGFRAGRVLGYKCPIRYRSDAAIARRLNSGNLFGWLGRLLSAITRRFNFSRAVRNYLSDEAMATAGRPLKVLIIGPDATKVSLDLCHWARRRGLDIRFTCIDSRGRRLQHGGPRLATAADSAIQTIKEDLFSHKPENLYDCAIITMLLHRLNDQTILLLIDRLRSCVRGSVLIRDFRLWPLSGVKRLLNPLRLTKLPDNNRTSQFCRWFNMEQLHRLLSSSRASLVIVKPCWPFKLHALISY